MKVTLPKDYRRTFTLEELDTARRIIRDMKDDDFTATQYAEVAVSHWLWRRDDVEDEVIRASAKIAKNCRAWDAYGEGTECMDIWIESLTKTHYGYLELGAYLTDIWNIGGDADFTQYMYARHFTEKKNV